MATTLEQEENSLAQRTFEDVEKLVTRLYQPGSPVQIARIQQSLQAIQKSPEGWAFADVLLQSRDANVRFFGALTFTIKINTDWVSLGDESSALLERLLSWLIRRASANEGALVVRKLCSALVAYFLQPKAQWSHCIRHLLCSFYAQSTVPETSIDEAPLSVDILQTLDVRIITALLWFATTLVEEAGKMGSDTVQTQICHEKVASNLDDMIVVLDHALHSNTNHKVALVKEGTKCFQSWVLYAQRAWFKQEQYLQPFKSLNGYIIEHFKFPETMEVSQEFLVDVMVNFPSFLTAIDYEHLAGMLCNPTNSVFIKNLRNGEFDGDTLAYARLVLAFGDAKLQDIVKSSELSHYGSVLGLLEALLMCKGYAIAEDEICSQAIEFWNTLAEYLVDEIAISVAGGHRPTWIPIAVQTIMRVIQACWNKVQLPPPQTVSATWNREVWTEFKAFRKDVEDFIQTSYYVLGVSLLEHYAQLALDSLDAGAWYQLEATLFCLNALADSVSDEDAEDQALSRIFDSGIFTKMTENAALVAIECQQTAVDMINYYGHFFERHTDYLPQTLNFLFASLRVRDLMHHASKAIQSMCDSCRRKLAPELNAFLYQYGTILSWNTMDIKVKERIVGGIAAIIQALTPEEAKLAPLDQLLFFVQCDVEACLQHLGAGRHEEAISNGLGALGYLHCIGKAMQVPEDVPIDLEPRQTTELLSTVWEQDSGRAVQSKIVQFYEAIFFPLQYNGDIVEATCHVLRTGYTESTSGPFVLSPLKTAELVVSSGPNTARPGLILDTARSMLTRNMMTYREDVKPAVLQCFQHALKLAIAIDSDPTNDPEIAASCIDFAEKLIPRYLDLFFDSQVQIMLLDFFTLTLKCLTAVEILPKRSAAEFWTSFVQVQGQPPSIQDNINTSIRQYGPDLAQALIMGIGGEAVRSELDTLSNPLRKMIFKQPRARQWLEQALTSSSFPSQLVSMADKRVWLQKVLNLRGARGTNQIVKDFWMACRGTNLAFAS